MEMPCLGACSTTAQGGAKEGCSQGGASFAAFHSEVT